MLVRTTVVGTREAPPIAQAFLGLLIVVGGCDVSSARSGMPLWGAPANNDGNGMAVTQPETGGRPASLITEEGAGGNTGGHPADGGEADTITGTMVPRDAGVVDEGARPDLRDTNDTNGLNGPNGKDGGDGSPGNTLSGGRGGGGGPGGTGGAAGGATGAPATGGAAGGGGGGGAAGGDAFHPTSGEGTATDDALAAKRGELIQFLWGDAGFPFTAQPSTVELDVVSPVRGLRNLARVDTLHLRMDPGVDSLAHHFIPAQGKRNQLVILHHGHDVSFDDREDADPDSADVVDDVSTGYGLQKTIDRLLFDGFSVLAVYMPGCLPLPREIGCTIPHEDIVATETTGSGMKFFVEPVATYLNYLQTQFEAGNFPEYTSFNMVGLSGGGWTTTLYAAIDPRITVSVPIAASLPFPLRGYYSLGDEEQVHEAFYAIAGYVDLYLLGGYGKGRRQIQVLNRYDSCCFGADPLEFNPPSEGMSFDEAVRGYETEVQTDLGRLSGGSFRLVIDELAPRHMISAGTLEDTIVAELEGGSAAPPPPATIDQPQRQPQPQPLPQPQP